MFEIYLFTALVYWIALCYQWRYMFNNDMKMPEFYINYYDEQEIEGFRKLMDDFNKENKDTDETIMRYAIIISSYICCFVLSILWPYHIFMEIVNIFRKS